MADGDLGSEEIAALLAEVKQRVRSRFPGASVPLLHGASGPVHIPLVNLVPLVQARDAAQTKVASIGSVNPRRGGPLNRIIQSVKRALSRGLGWFVRDQITFNRQVMACVEATIEAMNEVNRSQALMASQFNESAREFHRRATVLSDEVQQLQDIRVHWHEWRIQWEKNLASNEMQFLRTVADLQTGFSHRATLMENNFRENLRAQHNDYLGALDRSAISILKTVREEYDRLIQGELRVLRQRIHSAAPNPAPVAHVASAFNAPAQVFDYTWFAERFRGTEAYVRSNQEFYIPFLKSADLVLDIGCGRGELLETLRDNGIAARGIELGAESVSYCRSKGLDVEEADLFTYLNALPPDSESAIVSAQVVEHLDPMRVPEMVRLCASRLRRGGVLIFETPNPDCLAIFATYFYLDPTHARPVPHALLRFYMEEAGIGGIEVQFFAPAADSFPEIHLLPPDFAKRFFGGLDYAIIGRKL